MDSITMASAVIMLIFIKFFNNDYTDTEQVCKKI